MSANSLQRLYIDELQGLYDAESQVLKVLPKLASAASDRVLRETLTQQIQQTQERIACLERLLTELDQSPKGMQSQAMLGMIKDSETLMKSRSGPSALDAALIAHAQAVEHYQIAKYGTVRAWARRLGFDSQAAVLEACLHQETEVDRSLSQLAEGAVNLRAAAQPEA